MKRLIKKSLDNGTVNLDKVSIDPTKMENMMPLDQLSEADVRHDRCPICNYNPLLKDIGFKYCQNCESVFKVLNGSAYLIDQNNSTIHSFDNLLKRKKD